MQNKYYKKSAKFNYKEILVLLGFVLIAIAVCSCSNPQEEESIEDQKYFVMPQMDPMEPMPQSHFAPTPETL